MPLIDWLLALLTILIWGLNFLVSKAGISELPPLFFGFCRFVFVFFPAIFFIPKPKTSWSRLLVYGLTINFFQFGFMLSALGFGLAAGVTSLLLQVQVFFTILISALYFHEKVPKHSVFAFVVAACGIALIITMANTNTALPIAGLICIILAALSWATGNITIKIMRDVNMVSLVVWGGLVSVPAFGLASFFLEGPELITQSLQHLTWRGTLAFLYGSVMSTLVGYVIWGRLLSTRPVSLIAPLTLLVPIIGLVSNAWVFNEALTFWQWIGVAIVMLALVINTLWPKFVQTLFAQKNAHP